MITAWSVPTGDETEGLPLLCFWIPWHTVTTVAWLGVQRCDSEGFWFAEEYFLAGVFTLSAKLLEGSLTTTQLIPGSPCPHWGSCSQRSLKGAFILKLF